MERFGFKWFDNGAAVDNSVDYRRRIKEAVAALILLRRSHLENKPKLNADSGNHRQLIKLCRILRSNVILIAARDRRPILEFFINFGELNHVVRPPNL
jgi:hypothetical protein